MQKIVMFFKRSLICFILSFSLLCNNTAAVTYQAAAIPVVYTGWQVVVTFLALLGIVVGTTLDNAAAKEEQAQEIVDKFVGWKVLKGEGKGDNDGDGKDDLYSIYDPLDWLKGDKLTVSEDDIKDWQDFAREQGWTPNYKPLENSVDLYGCTYQEFLDYFCPLFNLTSNDSKHSKFLTNSYNSFSNNNYNGLFFYQDFESFMNPSIDYAFYYFPLSSTVSYSWCLENDDLNRLILYRNNSQFNTYSALFFNMDGSCSTGSSSGSAWGSTYYVPYLFIEGHLYDFDSIFSKPSNITTGKDYGNKVYLSDFSVSQHHFSDNVTDAPGTVGDTNLGDLIDNGDYDVIGPGRDYDSDKKDTTGDLTVTMPSGDILSDYENGLITYEELLEKLGVTPIDKANGTNLFNQELLDTNTGILSGIDALVDFVGGLFDGLIEMFSRLFIPSNGYFESYFTRINDFFDSRLGFLYTPFDLLIRFLSALPSVDHSSTQIYFPGLKFQEYVLCEPMYVELNLRDEFPALYRYMYFITDTILIGAVLWLLQSKTKELIKG